MRTREGEEGTSSAVAFAVAGVLFIGAISTVLVYANDRIPPPAKSQPYDSLAAEARVLLQSFVMTAGTDPWADATGWSEAASKDPGLACSPSVSPARCSPGATRLDKARLDRLVQGRSAPEATADGKYTYEELRTAFGLSSQRQFNLTVTRADAPSGTPLWSYGQDVPERVPTRPAVVYAKTTDGVEVRVVVHVFLR